MSLDLEDLKRKAMAASSGLWTVEDGEDDLLPFASDDGSHGKKAFICAPHDTPTSWYAFAEVIVQCDEDYDNGVLNKKGMANAAYIAAANPSTVLEMIERLKRAEQKATNAERLGKAILVAKNGWADRAAKAEERVAYLESAWNAKTLIRKDAIIGRQEAENDRLKALLCEPTCMSAVHDLGEVTDKPAKVGNTVYSAGNPVSMLLGAAYREYDKSVRPQNETDAELDNMLDELLEQIEAACKPPASEPKQKTLLDWIRDRMVGGGR